MEQIMLDEIIVKVNYSKFDFKKDTPIIAMKGNHKFLLTCSWKVVTDYHFGVKKMKVYHWNSFYSKTAISRFGDNSYMTRERAVAEALNQGYEVISCNGRAELGRLLRD